MSKRKIEEWAFSYCKTRGIDPFKEFHGRPIWEWFAKIQASLEARRDG